MNYLVVICDCGNWSAHYSEKISGYHFRCPYCDRRVNVKHQKKHYAKSEREAAGLVQALNSVKDAKEKLGLG